ncbi:hypothetical protein LTR94_025048, partial [Friedmanniomyces endolithicus]
MICASIAAATQAAAQETEAVTDLSDVDVQTQTRREQARSFVEEVTTAPVGRLRARWERSICIGVNNLDARYARFMIDRISLVALETGVEVDGPGCKPDIQIVAAADANDLARALVQDDRLAFRPALAKTDLGDEALERFQTTDAPVRWWHVSLPVM